jgi:Domain of unknown function (DUF4157)
MAGPHEREHRRDIGRVRRALEREEEDLESPPRMSAAKVTTAQFRELAPSVRARTSVGAGKLARLDDDAAFSPEQALAYSSWLLDPRRVDRRAESGPEAEGALASAFAFIEEVRDARPLPGHLRVRLEEELGVDLASVRIYTDDRAAQAAAELRAQAFTIGDNIYFAAGAYDPFSEAGLALLAHEVAHVAQQRRDAAPIGDRRVSRADDAHEREAESFARDFVGARTTRSKDPASVVNRMRAGGERIPLPFREELEQHFQQPLDFVEVYAGESAKIACELLSAGAFAVRGIVALSEPTPRREQLLHELAHIVQMGGGHGRRAPDRLGFATLRVSQESDAAEVDARAVAAGAQVQTSADPDVIHRDTTGTGADTGTPEEKWTLQNAADAFRDKFVKTLTLRNKGDDDYYFYIDDNSEPGGRWRYEVSSVDTFQLAAYQRAIGHVTEKDKKKSAKDLIALRDSPAHWKSIGLTHVAPGTPSKDSRRWAYIDPNDKKIAADVRYVFEEERSKPDPRKQWQAYCDAVDVCHTKGSLLAFKQVSFKPGGPAYAFTGKRLFAPTLEECKLFRGEIEKAILADDQFSVKPKSWWKRYYDHVARPAKLPQGLVGEIFKNLVKRDLQEFNCSEDEAFFYDDGFNTKSGLRRADGYFSLNGAQILLEAKSGQADGPGNDDNGELALQAKDYARILAEGIPAYHPTDAKDRGPFTSIIYTFQTPQIAAKWAGKLKTWFGAQFDKVVILPPPDSIGTVQATTNPTFEIPLTDKTATTHHLTKPPFVHGGMQVREAVIKTKAPGSAELATGGSLTYGINLGDKVVHSETDAKKTLTPEAGSKARFDSKVEGLQTSLTKIFRRVKTEAQLIDGGVKATLTVTPGPSGVPGLDIVEQTQIVVTYTNDTLQVSGTVGLQDATKKFTGTVKVGYAAGQWTFEGTATIPPGMVEGLSGFTAKVKYDAGAWSIGVDSVSYEKSFKAITFKGTASGVEYDINKGAFGGLVRIQADLGMFGTASATAVLEDNKLKKAQLSYDSPTLKYPAKSSQPTFTGTIGGTLDYENEKFSGQIRGTAELVAPMLTKLGNPDGAGLAVDVEVDGDGSYSGTISATKPIMFGEHFRIPSLSATLKKDGSVNAAFSLEVVKFKYLDEARIGCAIDQDGLRITAVDFSKTFGDPATDRISGDIYLRYQEGGDLKIGGNLAVQIRKGFVAKGGFTYDFKTAKLDAKLTTEEIDLIKMAPVNKTLFEISRKIPIINVYGLGVYIDIGFDLAFNMDFNLKMKPTISLEKMSLDTFDYESVNAQIELIGSLIAQLTGTPKVGLGIFVLSPDLLSGGGGVKVPITGKMELKPSGSFMLKYSPKGGIEGGAKLGLGMTFGITGAVLPYAEFSVLKDMWNPKWTGEPLASFTLMKPRDLLNLELDLGGDLSKPIDAKPPEKDAAAPAKEVTGDRVFKNKPEENQRVTPIEKPAEASQMPYGPGKDSPAFNTDMLTDKLKDFGPMKALDKILKTAGEMWDKIKGSLGYIAKIVTNWFNGSVDAMEGVIRGIGEKGLVRYLGDVVKQKIGDTAYGIIQPLFEKFATIEDKMMSILSDPLPTSPGEAVNWIWGLLQKLLGIGWGSIFELASAVGTVAGNLAGQMGNLLKLTVEGAQLGVKRHQYWVGVPFVEALQHKFYAATQYKINIQGVGLFVGPSPVPNPLDAPGLVLYEVFENYAVPHNGDPARDRWK